eukprot:g16415.t1
MIDYDLVLIMGPNLLLGAMVGSFLNFALPSWLILLLLITILVHSVFKTFKKALQTLRKEREGHVAGLKPGSDARLSKNPVERCLRLIGLGKRYAEFEERAPNAERPSVVGRSVDAGDVKLELDLGAGTVATKPVELTPSDQVSVQSLQSVHSEPQYPKGKLAGFLLMWLVVVVSILFRGGHAAPGIVSMCSPMYWAFALATAIILLLLSAASSCMAGQDAVQADGSLQWTLKTSLYVSVWSLLAGTMAALCGIGGGMIMGPKLLDLGCLPQVQSATTATTLFVMSTSTAIAFLVQGAFSEMGHKSWSVWRGELECSATLDYSLWLGFATALGAVVGKAVVGWVVKRTQRPSVIMFLLGGIIALSVVVMSITGFIDVVDDLVQGNDLGFRDPCESGWRITFDGDIDKTLRVTASPAKGLEDLKLELRWEFLASPEGASPEDWQPMKQDMNDVLEKRWAKHWDGDDGTDFFNVESNGFTYRIDCYTMYQENLKTYRCRRIRRGEPRASMAAVLPKLMAKDAEIARLQAQNSDLFKELDKLDDKVRRLEQEKATLMDSVVEHDGQMMLQEIWRMGRQLQVKESGWRIPFDGDIDKNLRVTAGPADELEDFKLELRWEFLASPEGAAEDWQLMRQDMNNVLEKRWAKHWGGDNGTDIFFVEANGFKYGIDCRCMVQSNLQTHRKRRIRRGLPRPNMTQVLPKLAAKDAEIERLQADKHGLLDERTELAAKVAKLEQERSILLNSQADHATQMMLQESWRMSRQLQMKVYKEVPAGDQAYATIQDALLVACPQEHFGDCHRMRRVSITKVTQIFNVRIWKDYEFRKDQVRKELEGRAFPCVTSNLPSKACSWAELDAKINEILVIHGTTLEKTDQIATYGFDERLARESGLYGQGVYFTDQSCKSLQYSGAATQDGGCFIIARLVLGHPFFTGGPLKNGKVEPFLDPLDPSKGRFHSVIAKPGTPTGLGPQPQVHREYVIFNGAQAYPEMIVHFKIT